jgi:hypothetical protein
MNGAALATRPRPSGYLMFCGVYSVLLAFWMSRMTAQSSL